MARRDDDADVSGQKRGSYATAVMERTMRDHNMYSATSDVHLLKESF